MLLIPKNAIPYEELRSYVGSRNEEAFAGSQPRRELYCQFDRLHEGLGYTSASAR